MQGAGTHPLSSGPFVLLEEQNEDLFAVQPHWVAAHALAGFARDRSVRRTAARARRRSDAAVEGTLGKRVCPVRGTSPDREYSVHRGCTAGLRTLQVHRSHLASPDVVKRPSVSPHGHVASPSLDEDVAVRKSPAWVMVASGWMSPPRCAPWDTLRSGARLQATNCRASWVTVRSRGEDDAAEEVIAREAEQVHPHHALGMGSRRHGSRPRRRSLPVSTGAWSPVHRLVGELASGASPATIRSTTLAWPANREASCSKIQRHGSEQNRYRRPARSRVQAVFRPGRMNNAGS